MRSYPDKMPDRLLKAIMEGRYILFYLSPEFRYWRSRALERDNNECQMCKEEGRQGRADVVHHIKHLKRFPRLGLRLDNLLCLCKMHHNVVHPEKFNNKIKKSDIKERWE